MYNAVNTDGRMPPAHEVQGFMYTGNSIRGLASFIKVVASADKIKRKGAKNAMAELRKAYKKIQKASPKKLRQMADQRLQAYLDGSSTSSIYSDLERLKAASLKAAESSSWDKDDVHIDDELEKRHSEYSRSQTSTERSKSEVKHQLTDKFGGKQDERSTSVVVQPQKLDKFNDNDFPDSKIEQASGQATEKSGQATEKSPPETTKDAPSKAPADKKAAAVAQDIARNGRPIDSRLRMMVPAGWYRRMAPIQDQKVEERQIDANDATSTGTIEKLVNLDAQMKKLVDESELSGCEGEELLQVGQPTDCASLQNAKQKIGKEMKTALNMKQDEVAADLEHRSQSNDLILRIDTDKKLKAGVKQDTDIHKDGNDRNTKQ